MSDNTRFDPRFDPAFQPGYEDAVPQGRVAPGRAEAPPERETPGPPQIAAPDSAVQEPTRQAPLSEHREEPTGRVNPFLIALGALSALLVAAGFFVLSRTSELYVSSSGQSGFDFITVQALIFGSPILICLGLATGIGIIFVFALRWERKR